MLCVAVIAMSCIIDGAGSAISVSTVCAPAASATR